MQQPETDKTPRLEKPEKPSPAPVAHEVDGEVGGAGGPEPTRYGDWQHKGRVSDF